MGNRARRCSSLELAVLSGLVVVRTEASGVVLVEDPALWIGPGADDDLIATHACRRQLRSEGVTDEDAVRLRVAEEGFVYRTDVANDVGPQVAKASPRTAPSSVTRAVR